MERPSTMLLGRLRNPLSPASTRRRGSDTATKHVVTSSSGFEERYEWQRRVLGQGATASVRQARCRQTGKRVAVKSYDKQRMSASDLQRVRVELALHREVYHAHLVRFEGVFESATSLHMVTECLEGGEVFERVVQRGRFAETEAARLALQVLLALHHLHTRGVVHRDVKLENLVYEQRGGEDVKLIDLGSAARLPPGRVLSGSEGTLQYVAPEVICGRKYNEKVDLWSVGSVLYTLLTGEALFSGSEQEILQKNMACSVDACEVFGGLPGDAQDFVHSLLSSDPAARPTAQQALQNPWLHRVVPREANAAVRLAAEGSLAVSVANARGARCSILAPLQRVVPTFGLQGVREVVLKVMMSLGVINAFLYW